MIPIVKKSKLRNDFRIVYMPVKMAMIHISGRLDDLINELCKEGKLDKWYFLLKNVQEMSTKWNRNFAGKYLLRHVQNVNTKNSVIKVKIVWYLVLEQCSFHFIFSSLRNQSLPLSTNLERDVNLYVLVAPTFKLKFTL